MYVSFETYSDSSFAGLSEDEYNRVADIADSVIDDWTYERVGKAVERGEELPRSIVNLYCAIAVNASEMIEQSKSATDAELSSFSNGVDSYGFDTSSSMSDRLYDSLQWLVDALPLAWTSSCIYPANTCGCNCAC